MSNLPGEDCYARLSTGVSDWLIVTFAVVVI